MSGGRVFIVSLAAVIALATAAIVAARHGAGFDADLGDDES